jgi:hypothetical protein
VSTELRGPVMLLPDKITKFLALNANACTNE